MASAKFLEEALSTDVDESAVSALVGSLETQLVGAGSQNVGAQSHGSLHNHVNSALPNGGTADVALAAVSVAGPQQHKTIVHLANGGDAPPDALNALVSDKHVSVVHTGASTGTPTTPPVVVQTISGTNNNNNVVSSAAAQVAASALHHVSSASPNFVVVNKSDTGGGPPIPTGTGPPSVTAPNQLKVVYSQVPSSNMTTVVLATNNNRVATYATAPNGTVNLAKPTIQQSQATAQQQQQQPQQTILIKNPTSSQQPTNSTTNPPGIVTVGVPQVNNVGSVAVATQPPQPLPPPVLTNLTSVVNVKPPAQPTAGVKCTGPVGQQATTRVVLGAAAPHVVAAGRPGGPPQLTLQSLHGLQPGQQGHLLLKTENGQYQLLRVGPAPTATAGIAPNSTPGAPLTFRMQTVPTAGAVTTGQASSIAGVVSSSGNAIQAVAATQPVVQAASAVPAPAPNTTPNQKQVNDQNKEKCRKFLANLLELSSREPRSVERSVRTLIQELIDMRVEPEDFCERLEQLLNASPQPCLIGFLKSRLKDPPTGPMVSTTGSSEPVEIRHAGVPDKSLPFLRTSLVTKELSIEGIRPPPSNVVYSIVSATPTVQTQIRPVMATSQVRLVAPGTTVVRPGQLVQQRLVTAGPVRGTLQASSLQAGARMVAAIRQPSVIGQGGPGPTGTPVIVSNSQPPALHPVGFANGAHIRPTANILRAPLQVRTVASGQVRTPLNATAAAALRAASAANMQVRGVVSKPTLAKDKDKRLFSSSSAAAAAAAAYTGDDDINDVAAMGGVNLAEETQRILGSTEFVGTQIRSCKEDFLLNTSVLQQRIRAVSASRGLDEPTNEVAAVISHAVQERLKTLVDKLAVIATHRLEMVKSDQRYELTSDVKGQLKFLEDVDRAERKKHEEMERELLLRAAKSRSKTEDPEQAKLKAKAKEMQRVEMEELRQREANATALQAIGPRKKPRLDGDLANNSQTTASGLNNALARGQMPLRARNKKVTLRDVQFLFENEKDICKSVILYKSYLK